MARKKSGGSATARSKGSSGSGREPREFVVNIRMTHEERSMLLDLVDDTGLSGSDILRNGLRAAYAAVFPKKGSR